MRAGTDAERTARTSDMASAMQCGIEPPEALKQAESNPLLSPSLERPAALIEEPDDESAGQNPIRLTNGSAAMRPPVVVQWPLLR